jgi:hypothetical protein
MTQVSINRLKACRATGAVIRLREDIDLHCNLFVVKTIYFWMVTIYFQIFIFYLAGIQLYFKHAEIVLFNYILDSTKFKG